MPARPWSDHLSSIAEWNGMGPHTVKAALQLELVPCQAARWVKNDCSATFSHPDAHRTQMVGHDPEANICKTLPDVQHSPQPSTDRRNKMC